MLVKLLFNFSQWLTGVQIFTSRTLTNISYIRSLVKTIKKIILLTQKEKTDNHRKGRLITYKNDCRDVSKFGVGLSTQHFNIKIILHLQVN